MKRIIILMVAVSLLVCGLVYARCKPADVLRAGNETEYFVRELSLMRMNPEAFCEYQLQVIDYRDRLLRSYGY